MHGRFFVAPIEHESSQMASDLETNIEKNADNPAKAKGDQGAMEQHPIPDQIAAAKFARQVSSAASTGLPIRFGKFRPPGAV